MIDGPVMMDLVVKVERLEDSIRVTTNAGTTDHRLDATVPAMRSVRRSRTGDYYLVPLTRLAQRYRVGNTNNVLGGHND